MKNSNNKAEKVNKTVHILFYMTYKTPSLLKEYKHNSQVLTRAIKESRSVEVLTKNEAVLKIVNLGIEAGKFFGLNNIKGKMEKIRLNVNEIKKITML